MNSLCIYCLLAISTVLSAQTTDSLRQLMLQDITVQSTRAIKNTPTTFTEISGKDISSSNLAQDLPILLEQTPSLVTTSDAGAGVGYTGMRIRGSDATRINVTINGIPYNDPESQGVYWVDVPDLAASVENVQIQRGVGTSTNGAGAFGGTVNIETSRMEAKPFATINGSYGSFNTYKTSLAFGTGLIKDHFGFEGRISKINSDGYVERASTNLLSYFLTGGYYGNKDMLKINVFSGIEHTYQSWYGVDAVTLDTNRTYNFEGTEKPGQPYKNQTDNYWQTHCQLIYNHQFNSYISASIATHYTRGYGYYEEYKANQQFVNYGLNNPIIGTDTIYNTDLIRQKWLSNHFYGTVFSLNYNNQHNLNITGGGAWNQYNGDAYGQIIWAQYASNADYPQRYYDSGSKKNDLNLYAKVSYQPIERLTLYGDLQYRNVAYLVNGLDENNRNINVNENLNFFNPKAGVSFSINNHNSIYTSFAVGNHEPMRTDYTDAKVGVKPTSENLKNLELGYHFTNNKVAINANYYLMYYKNQLVLTGELNDVGTPIRTNVPKSYRMGIELQAKIKPIKYLVLDLNATWSMNKILDFNELLYVYDTSYNLTGTATNHYKSTDIALSPNWIGGATVAVLPINNLEVAFITKYVGKQYLDNTGNETRRLNQYAYENLRISYTLPKLGIVKSITLTLMVNNLFNTKYQNNGGTSSQLTDLGNGQAPVRQDYNYYYPQAGINVLGGVNIKF